METILLALTIVSLAAAFLMGAAVWRLSRDERARSAARIAALAAEADAADSPRAQPLADAITSETSISPVVSVRAPWAPARVSAPMQNSFLGSQAEPSNSGQRGLAIAAVVLFVTMVVGGYLTVFGGDSPAAKDGAAGPETPLELVSLRHERQNGELAITGLVRNPVSGQTVERVTAVVFLFDQAGALVKSSRADLDFTKLAPGDESPFVIGLDAPSSVARYRVSFRTDAGVIPHVDRRGQEPIARDTP
jgi:hypothetical protein